MIFLYYKDKMEKIDWEGKYDYLLTRYGMLYYYGKVPDRVKDYYLTDEGVYLVRIFMQRLYEGDFYFKIERKNEWGITHYYYYFGLDLELDKLVGMKPLPGCGGNRRFESYCFKHIVENAVHHYIGEGEAIAGVLLENGVIKLTNHDTYVGVDIDLSNTYLPKAWDETKRMMKKRRVASVTWYNGKITEIR
jgi:hypothetical protein